MKIDEICRHGAEIFRESAKEKKALKNFHTLPTNVQNVAPIAAKNSDLMTQKFSKFLIIFTFCQLMLKIPIR